MINEQNTIPKRIFYVWGAGEPLKNEVNKCILSWREKLPDYEIIQIDEDSIEYFNFKEELKNNLWFKTVYERRMFAYIADYIRIKVLYENGGIYLDTDVTVLKSFDDLLNEPAFVGIQDSTADGYDNFVEPAILGSCKNNVILKSILDFYSNKGNENIWQIPIYTMPQIFQYYLDKIYEKQYYPKREEQKIIKYNDITILPEKYLIPYRCSTNFEFECITKETYTIHWFNGSWTKEDVLFFLENKHRIPLSQIDISYKLLPIKKIFKNLVQTFFSIKNSHNKKHKIVTILGIKIKIKRKERKLYANNFSNNTYL